MCFNQILLQDKTITIIIFLINSCLSHCYSVSRAFHSLCLSNEVREFLDPAFANHH